jgi:cholestenol Delta-isomerase
MTRADKIALSLIAFFVVVALTIELYWLVHAFYLPSLNSWLAHGFAFYGRGDRGYFDEVSWFEVGLESFNIIITVPAYLVLGYAIVSRRVFRWPMQLCLGAYTTYSVVLYLTAKHVTGYVEMPQHDLASFLILYVPNLPWLFGNGYLALDAANVVLRAVRLHERGA